MLHQIYIKHINGFYPSEIEHGTSWSSKLQAASRSPASYLHMALNGYVFFRKKDMVEILINSLPLFLFDLIFSTGGLIHNFHAWHRPLDSWTQNIFRMISQTLEIPSNSVQPCWNHLKSRDFLRQQSRNHLNFHALLDVTHGIATCKAAHRNALVLSGNPIGFMGKIKEIWYPLQSQYDCQINYILKQNSWAWP